MSIKKTHSLCLFSWFFICFCLNCCSNDIVLLFWPLSLVWFHFIINDLMRSINTNQNHVHQLNSENLIFDQISTGLKHGSAAHIRFSIAIPISSNALTLYQLPPCEYISIHIFLLFHSIHVCMVFSFNFSTSFFAQNGFTYRFHTLNY